MRGWKLIEVEDFVKVYARNDDIRCIYPTAPKWAQQAAVRIWEDLRRGGIPTKKGLNDLVRGQWAKFIYEASKKKKRK